MRQRYKSSNKEIKQLNVLFVPKKMVQKARL